MTTRRLTEFSTRRFVGQADGCHVSAMGGSAATASCPGTASDSSTWGGLTYEYQYSSAGQTTGKRMAVIADGYYGGAQTGESGCLLDVR